MIVLEKKVENFMDEPADSPSTMLLCRTNILPSKDYLKAVALFRSDMEWKYLLRDFFNGFSIVLLAMGVFFFAIDIWNVFYQEKGFYVLCFLFILCSLFARRYAFIDYCGTVVIGGLVFFPDIVFNTGIFTYQQLFLWTVALAFWGAASKRFGVKFLPFLTLNATLCAYAVQSFFPTRDTSVFFFFIVLAVINAVLILAWQLWKRQKNER